MRRFSQRNHLVTLNEINITPLLDLAFVLLIIFIITTPMLEQSLKLNLPTGGRENTQVNKNDVRTIEVAPDGTYVVRGQRHTLASLEGLLVQEYRANPQMAIYIRADREEKYKNVMAILDLCDRHNIKRMNFGTSPKGR